LILIRFDFYMYDYVVIASDSSATQWHGGSET